MQEQLRVGIVGCGGISKSRYQTLALELADHFRIVAVCDLAAERAAERAEQYQASYIRRAAECEERARGTSDSAERAQQEALAAGCRAAGQGAARVYTDLESLVRDDEVQIVFATTQPVMHPVAAIAALEAGRHAFSEGPMAANLRDADAMIEAARRSHKKLGVQYCTRFFREARQAKLAIAEGRLGKVALGRVDANWYWGMKFFDDQRYGRDEYRGNFKGAGGGSAFVHGRYASDLLLHLMEDPLEEVSAFIGHPLHDIETEDVSSAAMRFRSGALGHATTTICAHTNPSIPYDRVEILGEKASLQVFRGIERGESAHNTDFGLTISSADAAYAAELRAYLDDAVPATDEDMQTTQMRLFLDAVRNDGQVPVSGESARAHVELVRATYKSAFSRTFVQVPLSVDDPFYGPEGTDS